MKHQKDLIENKNKEINDSVNYAQRSQQSNLTSDAYFETHTRDFFILFNPRDFASGDFYWALENEKRLMVMTADCTCHGVLGALVSMMGINFLNKIVIEHQIIDPASVLNQLRNDIITALNPLGSLVETKDGMDCSFFSLDFDKMTLRYANANNRFYIIRNHKVSMSELNKMPVGAGHISNNPFTTFQFDLLPNDLIITFTDGYADQFGGANGKKFKYKKLEELLLLHSKLPLRELKAKLKTTIDRRRQGLEQVDDIRIVGIKI